MAALAVVLRFYFRDNNYQIISAKRGSITEAIYGLGRVKTDRRYEIKLGVTSNVDQVWVREGDRVKKGTPLLKVDPTTFRAPFDGTVTRINAYVGETVLPQIVLLRLEDLKDQYIELSLEQESALRVRMGQPAKVSFETLRSEVLQGKVTALYTRDDEFLARIEVVGLNDSILLGMTADVSVEVGHIDNALLIPLRAISGGMVLVSRGGKREKVKVDIGHVDRDWAEVKGDVISDEDKVYVPGVKE